jgi:tetratricopeptide (TPR) repeat protein
MSPWSSRTYTLKTDKNGKFTQLGLRPGIYTVLLTNQKDALNYGPMKTLVSTDKPSEFKANFKEILAETAATNPEAVKKKEEEENKFKAMKMHFDNGVAAMTEATDLQKQIKAATAADQKAPLQDKRTADCQTAITEFQQAEQGVGAKEVGNHATVWQDLGAAYECVGRYDDAAAAFQKAIDLKPQAAFYSGLSTNLANSAAAQPDPKVSESKIADANAGCAKALALDPAAGATCYKNVGIVLSNKGRQKDAVDPLQKATQANPKDAQGWYLLGSALTAMMDCKQEGEKMTCTLAPGTQEAYQKCIDIDPASGLGKACKENLDGAVAAAGGADTTVSKRKKKS